MSEDHFERTPIVTIELQLRPWVPEHLRPYWWGNGTLSFKNDDGETVREFNLSDVCYRGSESAMVRKVDGGYGWVLVLRLKHDKARAILDEQVFPHFVTDEAES